MNLFVYGTLKDRGLIQSLLGRSLGDPSVATMPQCTTVISARGFPVIIPSENSSVEGVVWRGLTDQDFVILDKYEGCHVETPVYQRAKRKVIIDGKTEEVWVYLGTSMFIISIRKGSDERNIG
ncbi:gamma-glutamylcyclotransferase [Candidatus Poribacteria bacterium]|nr:MAG: gamma-glutamylcyclotransferase [Candidatus Poribacteria bacterium]